MNVDEMRREFTRAGLSEADAAADPIEQFSWWFQAACAARPGDWFEPNAMTLATAGPDGEPSARVMLLKGFDARGFTFFTNFKSEKGRQLAANPRATMVFYWPMLERQVRIRGEITKLGRGESEQYFHSRPRGSQIGAQASHQSEIIASRAELEQRVRQLEARYDGQEVEMPDCWGGYLLTPHTIEFWQGRVSRLHDRLRYRKSEGGQWVIERLSP